MKHVFLIFLHLRKLWHLRSSSVLSIVFLSIAAGCSFILFSSLWSQQNSSLWSSYHIGYVYFDEGVSAKTINDLLYSDYKKDKLNGYAMIGASLSDQRVGLAGVAGGLWKSLSGLETILGRYDGTKESVFKIPAELIPQSQQFQLSDFSLLINGKHYSCIGKSEQSVIWELNQEQTPSNHITILNVSGAPFALNTKISETEQLGDYYDEEIARQNNHADESTHSPTDVQVGYSSNELYCIPISALTMAEEEMPCIGVILSISDESGQTYLDNMFSSTGNLSGTIVYPQSPSTFSFLLGDGMNTLGLLNIVVLLIALINVMGIIQNWVGVLSENSSIYDTIGAPRHIQCVSQLLVLSGALLLSDIIGYLIYMFLLTFDLEGRFLYSMNLSQSSPAFLFFFLIGFLSILIPCFMPFASRKGRSKDAA